METVTRYDFAPLRAKLTEDGYLIDSPVVSRVGIFDYRRADGTIRKELRRPDAVFDPLHLASLRGKPVTVGHPGYVNAQNVRQHVVGTVLSEGRRDGDHLTADLVIYDTDAVTKGGKRELSLGYSVTLNEEPGEWNGQKFDAEQVAMIVNHCAIVDKGRAGVARLNLDGADAEEVASESLAEDTATEPVQPHPPPAPLPPVTIAARKAATPASTPAPVSPPQPASQEPTVADTTVPASTPPAAARLVLVRVDGIEYHVPPEVARDQERLRDAARAEKLRADTAEAERDALKEGAARFDAEKAQIKLDASVASRARVKLETEAEKNGVEVRSDMSDREMREAVIRKVRGSDARFDGKSDDYVTASYDIALAEAARTVDQSARNRTIVQGAVPPAPGQRSDALSPARRFVSANAARDVMIRNSLAR